MCTTMLLIGLVIIVVHPIAAQSSDLIILVDHYVLDEKLVKNSIGEVVLDIRPDIIEDACHIPKVGYLLQDHFG